MNNILLQTAIEAVKKAGKILKEGYGTDFSISSKEGINNLVTEYDTKSEKVIIEHIKSVFPGHLFLAEESGGNTANNSGKIRWIIDPLDGTVNFAHGIPVFCISIAAELNGDLLVAAIYHPLLDELFTAEKGGGAFLNGIRLNVSKNADIQRAFLVTGFPYNVAENPCNCVGLFVSIVQQGIPIRRLGSAALDLAYVAAGRFDGFWEIELNPWDVAAGILLVQEAGGRVTKFDLSEYKLFENTLLATNGKIHDEVSSLLCPCENEGKRCCLK